jgi:hypothetical protein
MITVQPIARFDNSLSRSGGIRNFFKPPALRFLLFLLYIIDKISDYFTAYYGIANSMTPDCNTSTREEEK